MVQIVEIERTIYGSSLHLHRPRQAESIYSEVSKELSSL
jgi:hypothetical protein